MNQLNIFGRIKTIGLLSIIVIAALLMIRSVVQANRAVQDVSHELMLPIVARQATSVDLNGQQKLFGIQMYGNTASHSKYHGAAVGSGAGSVRVEFAMPNNAPDNTTWGGIDPQFSIAAAEHGALNVIATLNSVPSWAAPYRRAPLYPEMYDELAEFVTQVVERYDGDGIDDAPGSPVISYWEFYNEPDANDNSIDDPRWGNHADDYALMLSYVYPAVKAANPNALVVFGGIAYDWFEYQSGPFVEDFFPNVMAAGGGAHFDVMNFHSYPSFDFNWTDNQGASLYEKTQAVRDVLAQYGYANKPMIITEAGWHSNNPSNFPSSYENQARFVTELFVQSMAADIDIMIWWMLYDPGNGYWDNGLVTNDDTPQTKLSYTVYQETQTVLSTAIFVNRFDSADTGNDLMEVYEFIDPVRNLDLYVAWLNPVDTSETDTIKFTGETATLRTIYGSTTIIHDDDDFNNDGKITVTVKGQPVFVEIDR